MIRRHIPLLLLVAVAFVAYAVIPGCYPDRALLSLSSFVGKDSRSFFTGDGSQSSPYRLHTFTLGIGKKPAKKPTVVSINDDPDRVFQASPPSPVDYAIILRNLQRLGMDRIAISFPLAWEETDAISLTALERELDAIPTLATAAPLTRGAVPSPIPAAFRRASIPLSEIHGNTGLLPAVNRIALPDVILGHKTSLAGFTRIESEQEGSSPHLLAKWGEDRVVISFALIAALDHYQIPPSELEIRLGEFISLGAKGPFIPIDEHGRLAFAIPTEFAAETVPMESLLKMEKATQDQGTFQPVILRSDLSATEDAYAAYAKHLAHTIAALCDPSYAGEIHTFRRLPLEVEIILLLSLVSLAYGLFHSGKYPWKLVVVAAIGGIIMIHFTAVATTSSWLPTLPALLIFSTYAAFGFREARKSKPAPQVTALPSTPQKAVVKQATTTTGAADQTIKKAAKKVTKKAAKKAAKKTTKKAAKKKPRKAAKKRTREVAQKKPRSTQ